MTRKARLTGRGIIEGKAEAPALVAKSAFTFAHGVDPKTGLVTDPKSDINGASVKGRVLVFPVGKGSTTGASWFLETVRNKKHPKAIINHRTEPIIVAGCVLAKLVYGYSIPVVSEFEVNPADVIRTGDLVTVNGNKGEITVRRMKS